EHAAGLAEFPDSLVDGSSVLAELAQRQLEIAAEGGAACEVHSRRVDPDVAEAAARRRAEQRGLLAVRCRFAVVAQKSEGVGGVEIGECVRRIFGNRALAGGRCTGLVADQSEQVGDLRPGPGPLLRVVAL